MKYHPIEMKIVLAKLSDALKAGKSEMDMVKKVTSLHGYISRGGETIKIVTFVTLVTL